MKQKKSQMKKIKNNLDFKPIFKEVSVILDPENT